MDLNLFALAWLVLTAGGLMRYNVYKTKVQPTDKVDLAAERQTCTLSYFLLSVGVLLMVLAIIPRSF